MSSGFNGLLTAPDLHGLFSLVCGQNAEHTWMPGGVALPCCERCLGLYVGAGLALLLHLLIRPRLTGRFLEWHGAFLLLMLPLGFHWVPQGAVLRTMSGFLFGAGVATFLWLPLAERRERPSNRSGGHRAYALCLAITVVVLSCLAAQGSAIVADLLSVAALVGGLSLATVTTADLFLGTQATARWLRRALSHSGTTPTASRP